MSPQETAFRYYLTFMYFSFDSVFQSVRYCRFKEKIGHISPPRGIEENISVS